MIKADKYLKDTILEIMEFGSVDKNPRAKWADGSPAHAKYVTQKVFKYDIKNGEFPITTLRNTALKASWYDIEAIYIKQTNIIEEMHPSIHSWWEDFVVEEYMVNPKDGVKYSPETVGVIKGSFPKHDFSNEVKVRSIGQTYGHTVRRYNLMNILLEGMETNPFGRRHMINLWQQQQMIEDPKALVPCAYMTNWNIREVGEVREIDLTLHQRSQDFCMTSSINPVQYTMFGMAVANHLHYKTDIKHELANLLHLVENCHIYLRHMNAAAEILERTPINQQPIIRLKCEPKDFYEHTADDFEFVLPEGIKPLSTELPIAV